MPPRQPSLTPPSLFLPDLLSPLEATHCKLSDTKRKGLRLTRRPSATSPKTTQMSAWFLYCIKETLCTKITYPTIYNSPDLLLDPNSCILICALSLKWPFPLPYSSTLQTDTSSPSSNPHPDTASFRKPSPIFPGECDLPPPLTSISTADTQCYEFNCGAPNLYIKVITPSTSGCDLIWKWCCCRYNIIS